MFTVFTICKTLLIKNYKRELFYLPKLNVFRTFAV